MDLSQQLSGVSAKQAVDVFVGGKKCCKQPPEFRLCPLGLQFYSPRKLDDLTLMEFNLSVPSSKRGKKTQVTCTGAVVRCQREKPRGAYRVWIKFLDLPDSAKKRIHCVSRNGKHLCCFCENF
jgi:hypothetical protein